MRSNFFIWRLIRLLFIFVKKIPVMRIQPLVLLFATFILTNSFKAGEEIKWVDFNTGYATAQKKNKIMLVDVYTDWCGWCKVMDKETYAKSEIAGIINADFVAIKFNPEVANASYTYNGNTYNGKQLEQAISNSRIRGYPATMFMNTKNNKSTLISGFKTVDEFKVILASAKTELK
jgi:thioredoxin-related protein